VLTPLLRHASVVADNQADVKHTCISSAPVALRSTEPKLSPHAVTMLPPLSTPFRTQPDPTAASKLYVALAVPATPPTLTADMPYIVNTGLLMHASVVADVHDEVLQAIVSSAPTALRSTEPKPSPQTATALPPLNAEFRPHPDPTAASKLYPSTCVPAAPPTVTLDVCSPVMAALDSHVRHVADVHDDVPHAT
jgi:hypothetical protein